MSRPLTPTERAQLIVTALASAALLVSSQFLGLTFNEMRALFALLVVAALYTVALTSARWAFAVGALCILGYLAGWALNRMGGIAPSEVALELAALVVVTLLAGKLSAARARLRESEERFRRLSHASMEAISIHDANRILDANAALAGALGYDLAELIGMNPLALAAPESRALIRQNLLSGSDQPYEAVALRKDGSTFPVEVRGRNIPYQGRMVRVAALRDLTERKRAEMETTRLLKEARRDADRLALINHIAHALRRTLNLDELLQVVNQEITTAIEADTFFIALYDPAADELDYRICVDRGIHAPAERQPVTTGFTPAVVKTKQPLLIRDFEREKDRLPTPNVWGTGQIPASWLGVPMLLGETLVGVISVQAYRPNAYGDAEQALLTTIAGAVAVAIQNARLFEAEKQRAAELEAVRQATLSLTASLDLPAVLDTILETTHRLVTGVRDTHIFLYQNDRLAFGAALWANGRKGQAIAEPRPQGLTYTVAREGQPIFVPDMRAHPMFANGPSHWLGAIVGLPLKIGRRVVGVMNIAYDQPHTFSESELRALRLLADQAAIAVENARLFQAAEAERRRLQLLYEVDRELASTLDPQTLLERAVALTTQSLGAVMGEAMLFVPHTDRLRLCALAGRPHLDVAQLDAQLDLRVGQGLSGWVALQRTPGMVEDVTRDPHWLPVPGLDDNVRSALSVPILAGGDLLGVLTVAASAPAKFGPEHLDLLTAISQRVAMALSNARLYDETRRRGREFAVLYETTRDLAAQQDLTTLLQTIVERATTLLAAPSGAIYLYDAIRGDLELGVGKDFPVPLGLRLALGEGMAGRVAQTRQPLIVDDYRTWEHRLPQLVDTPFTASVQVPMLYAGELIGVLDVSELSSTQHRFTEADARLLALFATHAAGAVRNARLLQETRARAEQLTLLYDAGLTLNRVLDPREQLEFLSKIAMQALRADRVRFYRHDPASNELRFEFGIGHADQIAETLRRSRFRVGDEDSFVGWVGKSRVPVNAPDFSSDPRWHGTDPEIRSGLWVPVQHENQLLGILCVLSVRVNAFTAQDERLLALFANQVAVALENARLYADIQQRLRELATLHQASLAFSQLLSPAAVGTRVIEEIEQLMGYKRGSIWTLDEAGRELGLLAHSDIGLPPDAAQAEAARVRTLGVQLGKGITGWVAQHGELVRVGNVKMDPRYIEADAATQSELCVPLLIGGRTIGAINVESLQANAFTEHDERLLTTLASQAAIAIENARLFQAQQTRSEELGALYDLSRALADAADFDAILDLVTRHAVETVHITVASVALLDGTEFIMRAAHPTRILEHDLQVGRREPVAAHPYCQRVLRQNTPIVLRPDDPALRDDERATLFLNLLQTLCLVPLRVGERALGLLLLGEARRAEREPFTAEKIRLARSIGDQAASALRRAELFGELEQMYLQTVLSLASAVEAKDTYTAGHAEHLAQMALAIGHALGMTPRDLEDLRYGAILHDIGKIGVPDAILQKPAQLDSTEWVHMRRHPEIGAQILAPVRRLAGAAKIVRHHHERYDGTGYPDGLVGNAIPLGARVLTVVDSYSAIVDKRVYKEARSHAEAIAELGRCVGTQFDPRVVEVFMQLAEKNIGQSNGASRV